MALLLQEADVRRVLTMSEAIDAVEDAFRAQARNEAVNFPRQRSVAPGVTVNVLCAASSALDAAAIKCYPIVRRDISVGSSFTVLLYRISTGEMIAVLEANTLGQIRTGAASAVATKYLARPESRVMALFGSGWQAESQLDAVSRVLPALERVHVLSRSAESAQRFADRMRERLNLDIAAATDAEEAIRAADVITTITGARTPLFDGSWLQPGVHVNAAGSNFADKQEIDATSVRRADVIAVDDVAVARAESGDLLAEDVKRDVDWSRIHPLAAVVGDPALRRTSDAQITLFESHGLGLEDLAAAVRAVDLARAQGVGMEIPLR